MLQKDRVKSRQLQRAAHSHGCPECQWLVAEPAANTLPIVTDAARRSHYRHKAAAASALSWQRMLYLVRVLCSAQPERRLLLHECSMLAML